MTTKAKSKKVSLADLLETNEQVRDIVAAVINHLGQTDGAGRTVARRLELMLIKATQSILAQVAEDGPRQPITLGAILVPPGMEGKARGIIDPKPGKKYIHEVDGSGINEPADLLKQAESKPEQDS